MARSRGNTIIFIIFILLFQLVLPTTSRDRSGLLDVTECDAAPYPVISWPVPPPNAGYYVGDTVLADFACTDLASGGPAATCAAFLDDVTPINSGSPLDTSVLGTHRVTVIGAVTPGSEQALTRYFTVNPSNTPVITTYAGGGPNDSVPALAAAMNNPIAVTWDKRPGKTDIYFTAGNQVFRYDTITTYLTVVAGSIQAGYGGDNGPATAALLNSPQGVELDDAGNLYIADINNHRIRKVDTGGIITTVAGSGDGTDLYFPNSLAVTPDGSTIYVTDFFHNVINQIQNGVITIYAGTYGMAGFDKYTFNGPTGISRHSDGTLYVADYYNHAVRKIEAGGVISTVAGTGAAGSGGDGLAADTAQLNFPHGVSLDEKRNLLFIADFENAAVRQVNLSDSTISTVAGNGTFGFLNKPSRTTVDSDGSLYITDTYNNTVRKLVRDPGSGIFAEIVTVAGNGLSTYGGDGGLATSAMLNFPRGLALFGTDKLYFSDTNNSLVRMVRTGTGAVSLTAGLPGVSGYWGDGVPATSTPLNYPSGLATDTAGNLYIADAANNLIRKVALNGDISTVAGDYVTPVLANPSAVAVGPDGSLFIADTGNNAIRRFFPSSNTIETVPLPVSLSSPKGLAFDGLGFLYIADTGNSVIRRVDLSSNAVDTVAGVESSPGFGGDDGPPAAAFLASPEGVVIDSVGTLFIADTGNHVIRRVGAKITTVAGVPLSPGFGGDGGPAKVARLNAPTGMVIDSTGALYIADSGNHLIRKVTGLASAVKIAPGAPTIDSVTTGDGQATITFTAPVSDGGSAITSYTATSSPGGFTASGPGMVLTVTGLTNGTSYTFTVTATNTAGAGPASAPSVSVTPRAVPGAPGIVSVRPGHNQATVMFNPPASDGGSAITAYTVTATPGSGTATGAGTALTVTGLTAGTVYTFTVTATNAAGTGPPSAPSAGVIPWAGSMDPGGNGEQYAWGENVGWISLGGITVTGASLTGYAWGENIGWINLAPASGGVSNDGAGNLSGFAWGENVGWINFAPVGAGVHIDPATGLFSGRAWGENIGWISFNSSGPAPFQVRTSVASVTAPSVPGAPTNVSVSLSNGQATVSFNPPASDGRSAITSYAVTVTPGNSVVTGAASPITISGLTGTAYAFSISASNVVGAGPAKTLTMYQLTTSAGTGGSVTPATGGWYDAGTVVDLQATAASGYVFGFWTGPVTDPSSPATTITMSQPQTVTASFAVLVSVTVTTAPAGFSFTVDGTTYTTPQTFVWASGSRHTIGAASSQTGSDGAEYVLMNWSDGGVGTHTVTVPNAPMTYRATFAAKSSNLMRFVSTGNMNHIRTYHSATLLPDGKVLIAGGSVLMGDLSGSFTYAPLSSAEVYDPATGIFTPTTGSMATARYGHTATLLPDGKVLIAGGNGVLSGGYVSSSSAEVYDPATGIFTAVGNMSAARTLHTATLLPDGKVLIAGGAGSGTTRSSAEVYDPATRIFTPTGSMTTGRDNHTATLLPNGKVLISGGLGNGMSSAEVYDPTTGTFTPTTGNMATARYGHTATLLPDGTVLIWGGAGSLAQTIAEAYEPSSGIFTSTGIMNTTRGTYTATLLPNGKILIAGGSYGFPGENSAEVYSWGTKILTVIGSMTASRYGNTATLLHNGQVLIAGGDYHNPTAELFTPVIPVTVQTSPPGLSFTADGTTYTTTQNFNWIPGSSHTIETTSPQSGTAGTRYVFTSWSDGGIGSHSVTAPTTATTYTANFATQYQLTTYAGSGGSVTPPSGSWFDAGTVLDILATAQNGYAFATWTGPVANPATAATVVTMSQPQTVAASFALWATVSITVTTNPAGRSFTVDGTAYTSAQTFTWVAGSGHSIETTLPQSGTNGTRYVFASWSDGGGQSHAIYAPSVDATYTADFTTEYQLSTSVMAGSGTVSPVAGTYYPAGTVVTVWVTPNTGFTFASWSGPVADSMSATTTVAMNGPVSISAALNPTPTYPLAVTLAGNGMDAVMLSTGDRYTGDFSININEGTQVNLTARPDTGRIFTGWTGCDSSTGTVCSVTMGTARTVTAAFGASVTTPLAAGSPVTVAPTPEVAMTFSTTSYGGDVTVSAASGSVLLPGTYQVVGGSSFEITTTAGYSGPLTVCITYDPATITTSEASLRLFHFTGTAWEDITTSLDTTTKTVCGTTASLSPFALAEDRSASAPTSRIDSGPSSPNKATTATFAFTGIPVGATFICSLDAALWFPCSSPYIIGTLTEGGHSFQVKTTATGATPATWSWTVDTTPPVTTITATPAVTSTQKSGSFSFTANESGSTFECKLDSGSFSLCTSPFAFTALADGAHTFTVRARDTAGNLEPNPPTYSWTIVSTTSVTVTTSPAGAGFTVDGFTYSSPQTFTWLTGSSHTIAVASPQNGTAGTRYVFASWSDGGGMSHSVTVPATPTTYTANFTTQYQVTTSAGTGGSVAPASGTWYDAGTVVNLQATANSGYAFASWTGPVANSTSAATTVTMSQPQSVAASFTLLPVSVTVQTVPAGQSFSVDGTTYTSARTFTWTPGSSHTIATTSPQNGAAGTRYVFATWSDSGAMKHPVTAPATAATYTASFTTEYQLTTAVSPAGNGTVTPASGGWYQAGSTVTVGVTPTGKYIFSSWSGPVADRNANPTTVVMNGPVTVTATVTGAPIITPSITKKTGPSKTRVWTISLANSGKGPATNARLTGLTLSQTTGAACTPVITKPTSFPLGVVPGNIPVGASATGDVTIDFSRCIVAAKFDVTVAYGANGGVSGSKVLRNQTQQ